VESGGMKKEEDDWVTLKDVYTYALRAREREGPLRLE
jgi:hypothetical protein